MHPKIGYLGPEGSHSEAALACLQETYPLIFSATPQATHQITQWESSPGVTIAELLADLKAGQLQAIFVPVENATEGSVREVLDALTFQFDKPSMQLEWVHPITHSLIRKTTGLAGITTVLSHPQALAQSNETLKQLLGPIQLETTTSTSQAVQLLLEKGSEYAALGSAHAATRRGLNIVESNICDNPWNTTRFILLSFDESYFSFESLSLSEISLKTSLCISPKRNESGVLAQIVNLIADYRLDMTKIESRPAKKQLGDYVFYIDVVGTAPPAFYDALNNISCFVKRLGVYPALQHPALAEQLKASAHHQTADAKP